MARLARRRLALGLAAMAVVVVVVVVVGSAGRRWLHAPAARPPGLAASAGDAGPPGRSMAAAMAAGARAPRPESTGARPLHGAALDAALAAWRDLHRPRGWLDEAATAALRAERAAAAEAIAGGIGAAPPASLAAVVARSRTAPPREQLLLVDGLARSPTAEGVAALAALHATCTIRRVCEEVLRGLGRSEGPDRVALLVRVLLGPDPRAAQVAAMALHGEVEATGALAEAIGGRQPIEVRLEAVHSLGGVPTAAAEVALAGLAAGALEPRLRVFLERELARRRRPA